MIIKKHFQIFRDNINGEPVNEVETPSETKPKTADEKTKTVFDIENIDFKQRQERRRGDRRRGFRRTDDRNLISRAKEEAQSIKEAAAKEGYEQGLKQAKNDIDEVKTVITEFFGAKQAVFDYLTPNIMEISFDIAKKIIKKEIEQDPAIILNNIAEILKELSREETKITLKVNPIQVPLIKSEIPEIAANTGLDVKITVIPDENIMEGGCLLTTANGVIDATIESQLSVISEALKGL